MMDEWNWNAPYVDRRTWILDHLKDLSIDSNETLVLLLIDYFNGIGQEISQEELAAKMKVDEDTIEDCFVSLSNKGYLTTSFEHGKVVFSIDGLFHAKQESVPIQHSLMEQFEMSFGRTLSTNEMQRILHLADLYDERRVICALNEAVVYNSLSLNYVERVLVSWKQKGLTIEELENGIRERK